MSGSPWASGTALGLLGAAFLAAMLAVEGLVLLWQHTRSPTVKRLRRRLVTWLPEPQHPTGPRRTGAAAAATMSASKPAPEARAEAPAAGWLRHGRMGLPGLRGLPQLLSHTMSNLQTLLQQAGWTATPGTVLAGCAGLALVGFCTPMLMRPGSSGATLTLAIVAALLAGAAPLVLMRQQGRRRVQQVVTQLPDALDLMARALRSGHGFSAALRLVADEGPAPLNLEFARVADQMACGWDADSALNGLAERVPQDDIRFFITAVRLQRQTGGQLAEVLGTIARLVRQRLGLQARVRVLTAEGRLSAQVLAALPPLTGGVIYLIRPDFLRVLWTDPAGVQLLQFSIGLMVLGGLWLWRLTQVRV